LKFPAKVEEVPVVADTSTQEITAETVVADEASGSAAKKKKKKNKKKKGTAESSNANEAEV
jgi:hypothetical protein